MKSRKTAFTFTSISLRLSIFPSFLARCKRINIGQMVKYYLTITMNDVFNPYWMFTVKRLYFYQPVSISQLLFVCLYINYFPSLTFTLHKFQWVVLVNSYRKTDPVLQSDLNFGKKQTLWRIESYRFQINQFRKQIKRLQK